MFDIECSPGFLIAKVHQRMTTAFLDMAKPLGVTPQQFVVLCFLQRQEGVTQTELSQKTLIDKATLGGVIDRLQKQGMVRRSKDAGDRRIYRIFLETPGVVLLESLEPEILKLSSAWRENLSSEEVETLCVLLRKFLR